MSTNVTDLVDEQIASPFQLLDLPCDVLAIVVAAGLTSPQDVASVALTSRRLHRICKRASFRLHLNEMFLHSTAAFAPSTTTTQEDAQAHLHQVLEALCRSFPGTAELNLASLPLGNDGVVLVQNNLPFLAFLKLSGCKKLTLDAVIAATMTATTDTETASALRCIDLQRCYQLTADALNTVLNASRRPGSKLSCAALSHLDLSSWSFSRKLSSSFLPPSPSSLRMLALHNGIKLTAPGLRSIVSACPLLEVLCLGGSVLDLDETSQFTTTTTTTVATVPGREAHSGGSSPTAAEQNNTISLSTSPSTPSQVSHPYINANSDYPASPLVGGESPRQHQQEENAAVDFLPDPLVTELLQKAGDCGISPVLLATSHGIWLKNSAAELAAAACRLPNLSILELTHCAPGLNLLVSRILEASSYSRTEKRTAVQVWDMCTADSVSAALHWSNSNSTSTKTRTKSAFAFSTTSHPRSDVEMMLTAMVRCSSPGSKITALHSAAEDGDVNLLSNLLSLGAEVDARDRGGASALFVACEAGYAGAVATLLEAGASATLRNAAGEAPLYIAALRGHERVVEVLLRYCAENNIKWQDQRLYGDGWTPLHAAAVSNRAGIANILLTAAGPGDAAALVAASNRYGQTCVHVAARKGTPALVQLLIEAGGSASLSVADVDGRTPADVAKRNGNSSAWRLLTGTMSARSRNHQLQRATTPTVEKKARQQPAAQHTGNRWVGRRLQQRKAQSA